MISGCDMQASSWRNIKPGTEFDKFFELPLNEDPYWPKGSVYDTLEFMQKAVDLTLNQTKQIAIILKGRTLQQTCKNIWEFLYHHIQYKPDARNVEQLRSPARAWADRKSGIDCDCYSIFISSILMNLQIPHSLRISEYDHNGYFQHVYVVVPKGGKSLNGRQNYFAVDPVVDKNDLEKKFTKKHDRKMAIRHQFLNGVGSSEFGGEFEVLSGLGQATNADVSDSFREHLVNTLKLAKANPEAIIGIADPDVFIDQLEYAIENWEDPTARAAVLEELEEMEEAGESTPGDTISGLACATDLGFIPRFRKRQVLRKLRVLRARRKIKPRIVPATMRRGTLQRLSRVQVQKGRGRNLISVHKPLTKEDKPCLCPQSMNGLNGGGKFWKKIKSGVKKFGGKVKKVGKKALEVAKKVGKAIVQQNPITWAIRGGLLVAFKVNLFKMSEKIKWGYATTTQARSFGLDLAEHKKVKETLAKIIKTYTKLGGKASAIKKSIMSGKGGGLPKTGGSRVDKKGRHNVSVRGLGEYVTAGAATTAASGVIATITAWLKKLNASKLFKKTKNAGKLISSWKKDGTPKGGEKGIKNWLKRFKGKRGKESDLSKLTASAPGLVAKAKDLVARLPKTEMTKVPTKFAPPVMTMPTREDEEIADEVDVTTAFTDDEEITSRQVDKIIEERETEDDEDTEKGFFAKNWMWLAPVALATAIGIPIAIKSLKGVNGLVPDNVKPASVSI